MSEEEVKASQVVIDAGTGEILGQDKSFQAQEKARQVVEAAQAGGSDAEIRLLQDLDSKLRVIRNQTSVDTKKSDAAFMSNLEARSKPVQKKKKNWW